MIYTHEVQQMCCVKKGANHPCAPIPEEGKWVRSKEIKDISGLTHGIGWCAPQQGACKLTLNVKEGIIQEALVETIGCSGMTHSAAMASEILPGKTLLEALNTTSFATLSTLLCANCSCKSFTAALSRLSLKAVWLLALLWKTSARVCAARLVRCSVLQKLELATWKWLKATALAWLSTKKTKLSVTSSSTSAR